MSVLLTLIRRNIKLFFKDKGMFFTSLITPCILLVLYSTFLGNVYHDSFTAGIPKGISVDEGLIDSLVAGQLVSSIFSVSCVTVAFCSNFLMVQDRANGTVKDLRISPVRSATLSLSYYIASLISTFLICFTAAVFCLGYMYVVGWYMSVTDVLCMMLDIFLLVLFGTALSSVINFFLSTQGQISAVSAIVSAGYGFICGAYMPVSSFSEGLRKAVSFLPGTYGTSLLRNHALRGVFEEMDAEGLPAELIDGMKEMVDCNVFFFERQVEISVMYLILGGVSVLLIAVYIVMNALKKNS